ncbi:hypothetical protein [Pseudomonas grandcourensis]|uniref:DUF6957 family protein n=1 Tax=Pseudomonas grandcourensis TaxID=3136736 RepID=UPI003262DD4A
MQELNAIVDLLHGEGTTMLGHELSDEDAVARVREQFPRQPFCLVRHWIWIDLVLPDMVRDEFEQMGQQAVMLFAHQVVLDSRGRFCSGSWVRSTPLVAFSDGCFFQTVNTVYVLLGHGVRKSAELSTMIKIF